MKQCRNCGHGIDENAIFCPNCGARVNGDGPEINFGSFGGYNTYGGYAYQPVDNAPSKLVAVLSFMFWWIGLAVWFFCRYTRPGKARSALKGLLSSACFSIPFVGAVMWALWKDDPTKRDFAKVSAVSAIVGAGYYALLAIFAIILTLTGAGSGLYLQLFAVNSVFFG